MFRSFNAKNLGSVGQRDAKLLAIKLWEWLDPGWSWIQADWFEWGWGRAADFFFRPPTLTAGNFEALWSTEPKSLALKDLNLYKRYIKHQETSYNFRLGFALSNRFHLHRAYLVTILFILILAVFSQHTLANCIGCSIHIFEVSLWISLCKLPNLPPWTSLNWSTSWDGRKSRSIWKSDFENS